MNIIRKILITILFTINVLNSFAQNDFCNTENRCLQADEVLKFKVYYNLSALWVGAGEATFTTQATTLNGNAVFTSLVWVLLTALMIGFLK